MATLLALAAGIFILASVIYSILFTIKIFTTSGIVWGLVCIFIAPAYIVWLALNWNEGKDTFLKSLLYGILGAGFSVASISMTH